MLEKKEILRVLHNKFNKYFKDENNKSLYEEVDYMFVRYIHYSDTEEGEKCLKDFAKEYFNFRNNILFTRNDMVEGLLSTEYKEESILNKLSYKKKLNNLQKLCCYVCKFERSFFNEIGISLLQVENARWCEEVELKQESDI